jgi:hypothetical protein
MTAIADDLRYVLSASAARAAIIAILRLGAITARMRARLSFFVCHNLSASLLKLIF